ncbi:nodal homolog 3-C-like [Ylistrum balloti]|uniref:nodal homolog 3-C-like n=1 Tax=Ylistrum balloti TaxID=509963 RepID=UPI002905E358|nr:nodal homolog 3-C-like [Ylistrum balloti]
MFLTNYIIVIGLALIYLSGIDCVSDGMFTEEQISGGKSESTHFLLEVYRRLLGGGSFENASGHGRRTLGLSLSNTIRTIHAEGVTLWGRQQEMQFRIPKRAHAEQFHQVEIRIKTKQLQSLKKRIALEIGKNMTKIRKIFLRHKPLIDGLDTVWDVTSLVRPWINGFHGPLDIRLAYEVTGAMSTTLRNRLNMFKGLRDYNKIKAILVMFSKDSDMLNVHLKQDGFHPKNNTENRFLSVKRSRRSTKTSNRTNRKRKLCQVKDFKVDFNTIGWGKWIVHPKHFNAKMCKGICPSPIKESLSPSNHAMLQGMMRANTHGRKKKVSMPCCVPTKLRPQSMLYYEGDDLVVRHHEDMVVEECGCR